MLHATKHTDLSAGVSSPPVGAPSAARWRIGQCCQIVSSVGSVFELMVGGHTRRREVALCYTLSNFNRNALVQKPRAPAMHQDAKSLGISGTPHVLYRLDHVLP